MPTRTTSQPSPNLKPEDQGVAFGDDVAVVWGTLQGTSGGDWLGVPPTGRSFMPFANVAPFKDGLMAGETIYFDLATLCEQTGLISTRFGPRPSLGPGSRLGPRLPERHDAVPVS